MRYLTVNLVLEFISLLLLVTKKDSYINAENVDETCDEITMPLLSAILQGKYLDGYVFGNIPVLDKNFCLIQCLHQRQCKSVNYEEDTSLCYLNNEDHNSQPLSLKVTIDSKQYYPVDSVNEVYIKCCSPPVMCEDLHVIRMCETIARPHHSRPINLSSSRNFLLTYQNQESVQSCICLLRASIFNHFQLNFRTFPPK